MPQMTRCPRCGADNSVRRTTCYACGEPLGAARERAADQPPGAPNPRFAAVVEERGRQGTTRAAQAPPAAPAALPTFYVSAGQVRRAMIFYRQFHTLVSAGIPVAQALIDLERRVHASLRAAVRAMSQQATGGGKISDTMKSYPGIFLEYHVALVRAAELSGTLPEALDQIASDCESEFALRRGIAVALIPVQLVSIVLLLILPVALALREPPPGEFWDVRSLGARYAVKALTVSLPIAVGLASMWLLAVAGSYNRFLAGIQHRVMLSVPLVGRAYRRTAMMRFLGSLSLLLNAGVPVAEAYRTAAAASGNQVIARRLMREADNLYAGRGLVDTLRRLRILPAVAMDQMAIGETVGSLPESMGRLATEYRRDVEQSARVLPRLLQVLGYAIVAPLVFAVWYTLLRVYLDFRFFKPLSELFNVP